VILLRGVARLVAFLLLIALAAAGALVAVFAIQGGDSGLSEPGLAKLVHLPQLRGTLDSFLGSLEGGGPVAVATLLAGLGAILAGVLLLLGVLVPARERLVSLEDSGEGTLAARRRPLAQLARALADRAEGVDRTRVKVRPGRRSGGRLRVRADARRGAEAPAVESAIGGALAPLDPFGLKTTVSARAAGDGARQVG
jgi:hypothetical protein